MPMWFVAGAVKAAGQNSGTKPATIPPVEGYSRPAVPTVAESPLSVRDFLEKMTYTREEVSVFLDSQQPNMSKFDPDLGFRARDRIICDGVDGSRSIATFAKDGERTTINYADQPCRLHVYGDSFTEGVQVSDGETWAEYLAAHLGEPVRNFGNGAYGVYQAYRLLLRTEAARPEAKYLILNVFDDDHVRSVDAWKWLRYGEAYRRMPEHLHYFHSTPWAHVRLDLNSGQLLEFESPCATPESLYNFCDKDYVYDHFKNDLVVQLFLAERGGGGVDLHALRALATALKMPADFSSPATTAQSARTLHIEYGLQASRLIIEKAWSWARAENKQFMVLLCYGAGNVVRACQGLTRFDQRFVEFLHQLGIPTVDGLSKHLEDFRAFNLSPQDYVKRYFIGHYKPQGTHFFAFAIKDAVVDWLEPKPTAYRPGAETIRSHA